MERPAMASSTWLLTPTGKQFATFAFWPAQQQRTELESTPVGRFKPAILIEQYFEQRYSNGQVRRFARDTPDRLWPLSSLFLGTPGSGQRQLPP